MADEIERAGVLTKFVDSLRTTYPDAKKLHIDLRFEWQEPSDTDFSPELCPRILVDIER